MRLLIVASLLLFQASAFALDDQCYPNLPEAKDWPVCVIYLHGLHPKSDQGNYAKYEKTNRPILAEFSDDYLISHKCRMAAPVAAPGKSANLNWQHTALSTVESAAKRACGGAVLEKGRTLIGFSAGGWEAYHLGTGKCSALDDYKSIISIGVPELKANVSNHRVAGSCKQLKVYRTHDFAGQFSASLQQQIAADLPGDGGRVQTAELPETTVTN